MSRVKGRWQLARGKWRIRTIRGGKWWRERGQKGLSAIPHLFTLLNLVFGVASIILTIGGDYRSASLMVIGSLLADGLDGRLARMLKADGEFGKELDSLADIVSFGTAPAILLYEIGLNKLGIYGLVITMVFPMCGALRLARFNIIKTSGFFLGVPITAAGTMLSCVGFYALQGGGGLHTGMIAVVVLLLAYLMVSSIPYPDFKKRRQGQGGFNPWPSIGPVLAVLAILAAAGWNPWAIVLLPLSIYVVLGPWLLLLKQVKKNAPSHAGSGGK